MTQNTLSDEIKREEKNFIESAPGRLCFSLLTKPEFEMLLTELRLSRKSIAEKTVEAVRVEEVIDYDAYERRYRQFYFGCCGAEEIEGHNQAVTEQSKLASRWLGKDTNLA